MDIEVAVKPQNIQLNRDKNFASKIGKNRLLKASISPLTNQVAIFQAAKVPQEVNTHGSFQEDKKVQIIQWQKLPISRHSFINASLEIFTSLQAAWKANSKIHSPELKKSNQGGELMVEYSHKYQQVILRHVRDCKGNEASLFSGIHSIWHLAHIVCFENNTGIPASSAIAGWIRLNFSAKLKSDFEAITKMAHPLQHDDFWSLVYTCVLRGYFDAAFQLLGYFSEYQQNPSNPSNPVYAFENLAITKKFPKPEDYNSNAIFKSAWEKWNQEALFLFDDGKLSTLESSITPSEFHHFQKLFGVLAGDKSSIMEVASSWQDAFVGILLYSFPMQDIRNCNESTNIIKTKFEMNNVLDRIQLSLIENDYGLTLVLCLQFDWWLVTHLVDLFDKAHLLDATASELLKFPESLGIVEWHLVNYSEFLFSSPPLWEASIEYLASCPYIGKPMLEALVSRIPLDSNEKMQKILSFCKKNELTIAQLTILRILGLEAFKSKQYNQSISYFLESNDLHYIAAIVDELLELYITEGDKIFEDVVRGLSSDSLFKSNRLAFLARYQEFRQLYHEKSYKKAADLSILLITSGCAPQKFWKSIMLDVIPLLEGQIQVFSVNQIMELMMCAETCILKEKAMGYQKINTNDNLDSSDDALNVFRLAVSRALAGSLVAEGLIR